MISLGPPSSTVAAKLNNILTASSAGVAAYNELSLEVLYSRPTSLERH